MSKDRLLRTQQDLSKYVSSWITRVAYHLCNSSFEKQARMSQAQRLVAVPREGQEKHIWLHSVNRYVTSAFTSCRDCVRRRKSLQAWDSHITQKYSGGWHAAGGGTDRQSAQRGKEGLGPAEPLEVGGSSAPSAAEGDRGSGKWKRIPPTGRLSGLSWVGRLEWDGGGYGRKGRERTWHNRLPGASDCWVTHEWSEKFPEQEDSSDAVPTPRPPWARY